MWDRLGVKHPGTGEPSIGVRDILMFSMLINLLLLLLLLYLLAHRRALTFFASLGYEPCYKELCQCRGAFFFQHRVLIGLDGAQAVSLRMGGNAPSFHTIVFKTFYVYVLCMPSKKVKSVGFKTCTNGGCDCGWCLPLLNVPSC